MATWSTSRTKITINGQSYESVDQMPPEVRKQYETAMSMLADRDGNGIPDVLEGKGEGPKALASVTRVVVNGKTFSAGEVPEQLRREATKLLGDADDIRPYHGGITLRLSWTTLIFLILALILIAALLIHFALMRR
jgi:hypothetical protein